MKEDGGNNNDDNDNITDLGGAGGDYNVPYDVRRNLTYGYRYYYFSFLGTSFFLFM